MRTPDPILIALALTMLLAPAPPLAADMVGSKDHPLFTRMPGYVIESYAQKEFDRFEFVKAKDAPRVAVEGRLTRIGYTPQKPPAPSPLQIARNYQNAITRIGGTVVYESIASGGGITTMQLLQGGREVWAQVAIGDGGNNYELVVVEREAMRQEVLAGAEVFRDDLRTTGHAAVYGIYFDTDQAVVKPESEAALKEIAKLLQADPKLGVRVVGHTDGTGDLAHNMALSEARAKAVVEALTAKHGVAASRLTAHGVGPLAPVASNDTEEGRAKNRRVELVKK